MQRCELSCICFSHMCQGIGIMHMSSSVCAQVRDAALFCHDVFLHMSVDIAYLPGFQKAMSPAYC